MRVLVYERDIINGYGDMEWVLLGERELVECTKSAFKVKNSYRTIFLRKTRYVYTWYGRTWYRYEEIGECKND